MKHLLLFITGILATIYSYAQFVGPESITYSIATKKYYLSSAQSGAIYSFNLADDKAVEFNVVKTGLGFPRGMDCDGNNIYVTEAPVKDIVKIGVHSGKIEKRFFVKSAKDLNDVLVVDTLLFASDLKGNTIWMINKKTGAVSKLFSTTSPNGLAIEGSDVLWAVTFTSQSKLIAYNIKEKKVIKTIPLKYGYADGLQILSDGKFIISFWGQDFKSGKVVEFDANTKKYSIILDKVKGPADLLLQNNIVIIPLMTENRVVIKKIK